MRRVVFTILGLIMLGAFAWVGDFYYKNLRGIGPAVRTPKEDIAELLQIPSESPPTRVGENTTGMPLKLPPGFSIEIFAKDLPGARVLASR
ncbi:hypothetical protein HY477_00235 [Candidatus Uhrbacteria bacterium]|nr:hypothetical protein [Candidatus Uhrbacteria bacterium]